LKRYKMSVMVILLIFSLIIAGCSKQSSSQKNGSSKGNNTIVVGLEAEPTSLDAHQISDYNSSRAAMEIYDQLVQFKDESTELEPDLEKSGMFPRMEKSTHFS
jgi:peptide/nickel transport system substrate-binding protein